MDKFRKELIDLLVAVETKDPRIQRTVDNIKGGFNHRMEYLYDEALRRGKRAQEKREAE